MAQAGTALALRAGKPLEFEACLGADRVIVEAFAEELATASPSASIGPALATAPDAELTTGSELAVCVPVLVKSPAPWF
jgi:hypothetical protein